MPFRKLFRSRWSALLWAAGILWTAFDTVGFGPPATMHAAMPANGAAPGNAPGNASGNDDTDATGMAVNTADLDILANAMKTS